MLLLSQSLTGTATVACATRRVQFVVYVGNLRNLGARCGWGTHEDECATESTVRGTFYGAVCVLK